MRNKRFHDKSRLGEVAVLLELVRVRKERWG